MINRLGSPAASTVIESCERKEHEARITAYTLTIIALILVVLACFLFGLATLSPELTMGLGFLPFLAGAFIGSVGAGVFIGALFFHILASIRGCQSLYQSSEIK